MRKFFELSAVGQDRPGIVAALAKTFFEIGCNLEDSSMTQLKGDFAILLSVSCPSDKTLSELQQSITPVMNELGLSFTLRETPVNSNPIAPKLPYTLIVYGLDHPGIVYRFAKAASDNKINITDLRTHVTENNGSQLYSLTLDIEIDSLATVKAFEKEVNALKAEIDVEATLNPVETDEL
jgi:glycine cleavage system transcriptional repressor